MNKLTKEHIRRAGYVLKVLNNPKRMLIIDMLQRKELTVAAIQDRLKIDMRQTIRHLGFLVDIEIVKKYRGNPDFRTSCYTLDTEKYHHYISNLKKMIA